jgi:hypothetical protein
MLPAVVAVSVEGTLRPVLDGKGDPIALVAGRRPLWRYESLWASDAAGRELPAKLEVRDSRGQPVQLKAGAQRIRWMWTL